MIHTLKVFAIVNKAEIDVFLELSCFFDDPADAGNLISGSLPFLEPALHILLKPAWRILSINLLECEMSATVWQLECSLALPFFGVGLKTNLFQSCGHCWVFQICCDIECSAFRASSFKIWKSSMGNPSPPLALFTVMLPKAHLTWQCFLEKPWISVETAQVLGVLHFYNRTTSHSWFKANFS